MNLNTSWILGGCFIIGLSTASVLLGQQMQKLKAMERIVQVKGLAERDVNADTVIWPVKFIEVGQNLTDVISQVEKKNEQIAAFLKLHGFNSEEISFSVPQVQDRQAGYNEGRSEQARYTATSVVTIYSQQVDKALHAMQKLIELSKNGIAIAGQDYDAKPEFIFSDLNQLKPLMIEEATKNARDVATRFAADSGSKVGKIKQANQGQFSISDRDSSTPHIKKVRVVSTVDFYLSD
jgi:hypothetical protein